ncbi:BatD family protein [Saprospira sp. CCB-QB6]|uniref:BatD family protein n=1 Tax=Saprospira sp. CCB-QB6 TaxID=3023936 RepID=UPI00234B98F4|nr:BatD family protein [Saprospira sp. CCB-QB6]WCL82350.1 BatD family protein [Saprospira sp. CCB-QB6]
MKSYQLSLLLLSFWAMSSSLLAQKIAFVADCNASKVVLGNAFRVSFRLENAEIKKIRFPDFEGLGFQIVEGPVNESRYTNINGNRYTFEAYTFSLAPNAEGNYTIGPAEVTTYNGKVLKTMPVKIKCVAPSSSNVQSLNDHNLPKELAGKVLFRLECEHDSAVVGEQIRLNYKVYTQIDISNIELVKEPEFPSMYTKEYRFFDKEARVEVINGQQYATKIIYSMGVFPSKNGELSIPPAEILISVGRQDPRNPFASRKLKQYPLLSLPKTIPVRSLSGQDKDYTGAVGEYDLELYLEKDKITTDEALELVMRIRGLGDIKPITAPPVHFEDGQFNILEVTQKEDIREGGRGLGGEKTFTYKIDPQEVGNLSLRPSFVYFDVRDRKLIHIDTNINIQVSQGKRILNKEVAEKAIDSSQVLSMQAPLKTASWRAYPRPFFGSYSFYLLSLLPLLAFAGAYVFILGRQKSQEIKEKQALKRAPYQHAQEQLDLAKTALKTDTVGDFYRAIEEALKGYLGMQLEVPLGERSKERLQSLLPEKEARELGEILEHCEQALFAGQSPHKTMEEQLKHSQKLIKQLEKRLA